MVGGYAVSTEFGGYSFKNTPYKNSVTIRKKYFIKKNDIIISLFINRILVYVSYNFA
jgi:hypothetical protein